MDFTFSRGAMDGIIANNDLRNMMDADPVAFRSYYAQMHELLLTVYNESYMESWATHYSTFLPRENLASFVSYIRTRNSTARRELARLFDPMPFAITTNDGGALEVAAPSITLQGTGSYTVDSISVDDVPYELTWIDKDHWELTLPLAVGENVINLQALDVLGSPGSLFSPLGTDSITVTNTGSEAAASAESVTVSEIMYHPTEPTDDEIAAGFTDQDDFEYLELQNVSGESVSMAGARFTRGIDFDFTDETSIPAGGYLVIVANQAAFESRYPGVAVAGVYSGRLRNSGESLRLRAVDGADHSGVLLWRWWQLAIRCRWPGDVPSH